MHGWLWGYSFQKFLAQNPSGSIDKENYLKMATSSCGDDSRYMFERIFDTWDTNHDGQVDFKEYITSMSVMMAGNIEEKLKCTHRSVPHSPLPMR